MKRLFSVFALAFVVVCISPLLAVSQGIQQTPYSAADAVRRSGPSVAPDLNPSNPLGFPGSSLVGPRGSENISISSGMFQGILPKIPNLQLGYNYTFGPQLRAGSASVDYLLPLKLGADSTVYGEAHGEFQSLSISQPGSPNSSVELCFGGGYRRMFGNHTMVGLHSFFDTTKLTGVWYPSGSVGVEMAALVPGHDAIDLLFNWYGKAFDASSLNNLGYVPPTPGEDGFGNSNFDIQVGYSHELYNGGPDLRLSFTGYKFDMDSDVYGYYAGAELKSRDGMFVAKYDVGYDNTNQVYQSVAAFMNMGLRLENLVAGKSPFVMPKPVFQSPREMTRATEAKVNRNWRRTTQTATLKYLSTKAQTCNCGPQTITVVNNLNSEITLYMGFNIDTYGNVQSGGYSLPGSFPGWSLVPPPVPGARPVLYTTVNANSTLVINFPCTQTDSLGHGAHIALSVTQVPWNGCIWGPPQTLAEFGLCDNWPPLMDTYDISLVNGFDNPVEITTTGTGGPTKATAATGNSNTPGVYGYGWTGCSVATPPLACTPTAGENHPTNIDCNLHQNSGSNYTVYIGGTLP
ncbi:MAG: hypothetical protein M0T73_11415 [Deltaproteobacteria bacterium]|nr:hypothetical protein [Deltaproteobacteria bacterium]